MEKWEISKTFEFCYGHKVHNQKLEKHLALTDNCKCKHLHGHEAKIVVNLSGEELNSGMVTDFNNLNWLKKWIDDNIDHKFIIDKDDPHLMVMNLHSVELVPSEQDQVGVSSHYVIKDTPVITESMANRVARLSLKAYYESFVFVRFVPTSENLAKWIYEIVAGGMWDFMCNHRPTIKIDSVEWWETPKSKSVYRGQNESL